MSKDKSSATERWTQRDSKVIGSVLCRLTDVVAAEASGSWITDLDGQQWLDLTCGIAVTNLGHGHPDVVDAATAQLQQLVHTSVVARHPASIECAEKLCANAPFITDPRVFFCNTGAEAVDGSLKMARRITGRPGIIAFRGAFHGRTFGATSITTAKGAYREGYGPLLPGVTIAPYAEPLSGPDAAAVALGELDAILDRVSPATEVAAMIVEPILGEGGYIIPPTEWLQGLRDRCDEHGILLIFDEVQTGAGRTGRYFAAETLEVAPDIITFAKGVANGLPLGGFIASASLFDQWPTGTHGTTFGGNPVSCAAASEAMDVLKRDDLLTRVRAVGKQMVKSLQKSAGSSIVEVRGIGLMIGIQFADEKSCAVARDACLASNVLVLRCGPHSEVLRLMPPFTITDDEIELAMRVVGEAIA